VKFIVDAQLPPGLARYLADRFRVRASHVRDLGLRDADDLTIFQYAKKMSLIVVTKDSDFVELVYRHGTPSQIFWVTRGNTTNANLNRVFTATLPSALQLLADGETIVEITEAR
jgi:predicted nuclease of predicted toxin-antitoxin system